MTDTSLPDTSRNQPTTTDAESPSSVEVAKEAAQRSERIASRIEQGGLDEVMDDAKRFARNRPGLFLLSAIGAGFAVGRIIKNSDTTAITAAAKPDPALGSDASASSDGRPDAFSPQADLRLGAIAASIDAPIGAPDAWEA